MNRGAIVLRGVPNAGLNLRPNPGRWIWVAGVAVEGFSEAFPARACWVCNHNLGRHPSSVSVRNTAGQVLDVEIRHYSENQVRVFFDNPTAGVIEVA
jgi:hypothetical protein